MLLIILALDVMNDAVGDGGGNGGDRWPRNQRCNNDGLSLCFVQMSLYFVPSLLRIDDSNGDAMEAMMEAMDDSD